MSDRPILFSAPMILALLAGTKTQTRRVVKPQPRGPNPPDARVFDFYDGRGKWKGAYDRKLGEGNALRLCPYGHPGDRLWVRETWAAEAGAYFYRADGRERLVWRPSIFMPRWASRILLEITEVRVQRVQDSSAGDCVAEGVNPTGTDPCDIADSAKDRYRDLWDSINGKRPGCAWADNPWVWALTFKRLPSCPAAKEEK
jgi:hypothetical protein